MLEKYTIEDNNDIFSVYSGIKLLMEKEKAFTEFKQSLSQQILKKLSSILVHKFLRIEEKKYILVRNIGNLYLKNTNGKYFIDICYNICIEFDESNFLARKRFNNISLGVDNIMSRIVTDNDILNLLKTFINNND